MKKIFLSLLILVSLKSYSQDLSGIQVNITLRAGDWAFIVGHSSDQSDSVSIIHLNRLRDTMLLANPANFNTNVRFNSMPASIVYRIYTRIKSLPTYIYDQVGTNISVQIKAIVNTPLQNAITAFDNTGVVYYQDTRRRGKNFLSDN
jgi:hypothetical protein